MGTKPRVSTGMLGEPIGASPIGPSERRQSPAADEDPEVAVALVADARLVEPGLAGRVDPELVDPVLRHPHQEELGDRSEDRLIGEDVAGLHLADPDAVALPLLADDVLGGAQVREVAAQAVAHRPSALLDAAVDVAQAAVVGEQRGARIRIEAIERPEEQGERRVHAHLRSDATSSKWPCSRSSTASGATRPPSLTQRSRPIRSSSAEAVSPRLRT